MVPPILQVLSDRNVTLQQAGAVLGITPDHMRQYAHGYKLIRRERAQRLAQFLGVPLEALFADEHVTDRAPGRPRHDEAVGS